MATSNVLKKIFNSFRVSKDPFLPETMSVCRGEDMFLRIIEIWADECASVEIDHTLGDGIDVLKKKGLSTVIAQTVKHLLYYDSVFIPINFGDTDDTSLALAKGFGSVNSTVINSPVNELKGWDSSRYIYMELSQIDRDMMKALRRACITYEEGYLYIKNYFANANFTFFQFDGIGTILKTTKKDQEQLEAMRKSMMARRSEGLGFLGSKDKVIKHDSQIQGIKEAFASVQDDLLAKSGLDGKTLFGREGVEDTKNPAMIKKVESLIKSICVPLVSQLLEKHGLSSVWEFEEINMQKDKIVAEKELREMQFVQGYSLMLEKEQAKLNPNEKLIKLYTEKILSYTNTAIINKGGI